MSTPDASDTFSRDQPARPRGAGTLGAAIWFLLVGTAGGVVTTREAVRSSLAFATGAGAIGRSDGSLWGLLKLAGGGALASLGLLGIVVWLIGLVLCLLQVRLGLRLLRKTGGQIQAAPWAALLLLLFAAYVTHAHAGSPEHRHVFLAGAAATAGYAVSLVALLVDRRRRLAA